MALPALEIGVARRLVDLLSTDDGFRALFSANPGEALLAVGFDPQRQPSEWEALRICFAVNALASKEVIAAARHEINVMLTSGMAQLVPALDADGSACGATPAEDDGAEGSVLVDFEAG